MTYFGYAWQSMGPQERLDRELIIVDNNKKSSYKTPPKKFESNRSKTNSGAYNRDFARKVV